MIHSEQGIGDVLQFIRLMPILKQQGAKIVFACQKPLQNLLRRCEGIDEWFPIDEPANINFDLHIPLLSLPGLLNLTEDNCPRTVPYVFPDPEKVAHWKPKLDQIPGFKIGLGWQGSVTFRGDQLRSIPLKHYAPLAKTPDVTLISLQKSDGLDQLEELKAAFPVTTLEGLDETGGAFMDTAAVMQHLDLIITSDTALAHLAGALGRPVWLALSTASDWRWFRDREDSPWYPSMRLFRQKTLGDWDSVFVDMARELEQQLASDSPVFYAAKQPVNAAVQVEIAPGELIDKITILEIKQAQITDGEKLKNVRAELEILNRCRREKLTQLSELDSLARSLKEINQKLWDIEDQIRDCDRNHNFGQPFIDLARAVYQTNDRRSQLKRDINVLLGSRIVEEKSYSAY
jgi:ADP-heptose:LPS heptosyltransferase